MFGDGLRDEGSATVGSGALGLSLLRVEDESLLTGRATFVDDLPLSDVLEVAFARSSIAHGHLRDVDTSLASSLPGVEGVFSAAELDLPPITPPNENPDVRPPPQPVLASSKVCYAGEPIAVAVARTRYEAEDACEQLIVEIDELEPLVDPMAAIDPDAIEIHEGQPNAAVDFERSEGDVEASLAAAKTVIERTFTTPRHSALPIETRAVLARPTESGVEIWTSSQAPHKVRQLVSELLGLELEDVRVITPSVGGGFGVKAHVYPEEVILPALALKLGKTVKWVEDRAENLAAATQARAQQITVRAGLDDDGVLCGMDVEMVCDQGAYGAYPHGISLEAMTTSGMLPGPYRLTDFRVRVRTAMTNKSPMGAYRGVGFVIAAFVHERVMDLLAREAGIDAATVRRLNLVGADEFPYQSITHQPYDSGDYRRAMDSALERIGYEKIREEKERADREGRRLGFGMACYVEPTGMNSKVFKMRGMVGIEGYDSAHAEIAEDGVVRIWTTTPAIGQGSDTTLAQMAAEALGVPAASVRIENSDTAAAELSGTGTFASRSAVSTGGAVQKVCLELRRLLLDDAAEQLEASAGDLEIAGSEVRVAGSPGSAVSIGDLVRQEPDRYRLSETHDPPQPAYPYATHACVVSIDEATGEVRIEKYVIVEDCGTIINPMIVEGQVLGAMAQGVAGALFEAHDYDQAGQLRTASLLDYLVPTAAEIPEVELSHLEIPSPVTPFGVKGAGEGGTIAPAPALANAIGDAVGAEFNGFPVTPEQVWSAIRSSRK